MYLLLLKTEQTLQEDWGRVQTEAEVWWCGYLVSGEIRLRETMQEEMAQIWGHLEGYTETVQWKFPGIYEGDPNKIFY